MSALNDAYRWIRALNSGSYEQGRGSLATYIYTEEGSHNTYCCLGVLAKECGVENDARLADLALVPRSNDEYYGDKEGFDRAAAVIEEFQLDQGYLADMNDQQRLPFKYIAKYIAERVTDR